MNNQKQSKENITLLEKGKKGVIHMIFSRFGIVLLLLLVQVFFLFGLFFQFRQMAPHYIGLSSLFYLIMIVVLVNSDHEASSKITWLIIMVLFPVFGAFLYIYTSVDIGHRALKKRITHIIADTSDAISQDEEVLNKADTKTPCSSFNILFFPLIIFFPSNFYFVLHVFCKYKVYNKVSSIHKH